MDVRAPHRSPKIFSILVMNPCNKTTLASLFSSIFRMKRICEGKTTLLPSPLLGPILVLGECFPICCIPKGGGIMFSL